MSIFSVTLYDGNVGLDARTKTEITASCLTNNVPSPIFCMGYMLGWSFDVSQFLSAYDTWKIGIDLPQAKTAEYVFTKVSTPKTIKHTLLKKTPKILDPVPMPDPTPTTDRLVATYRLNGAPVANLPWDAIITSGVTDAYGQVVVPATMLDVLTLTIEECVIEGMSATETVEINITDE